MNIYKYTSRNENDTVALAQNIESEKFPNMVICLDGELGSGKTVFVKGFAHALGIEDNITSPTFNIIKEYNSGELPLYHMDVYRLDKDSNDTCTKKESMLIRQYMKLKKQTKKINKELSLIRTA